MILDKTEFKSILNEVGIKQVLTQNSKMRRSSQNGTSIYNWTIPAYQSLDGTRTCPNAMKCIKGCYARQGAYIWTKTKQVHQNKLNLTRHDKFIQVMITDIANKLKSRTNKGKNILIRIHDAGDFYNIDYTLSWFRIMNYFKDTKNLHFYAYTKQVERFKSIITNQDCLPSNFTLIYSYGGKQDALIDPNQDRHSFVFQSETELIDKGYIDASDDDIKALGPNFKVGLVYHGTKSYNNTTWNKVQK